MHHRLVNLVSLFSIPGRSLAFDRLDHQRNHSYLSDTFTVKNNPYTFRRTLRLPQIFDSVARNLDLRLFLQKGLHDRSDNII
jgi:hypothetical protein